MRILYIFSKISSMTVLVHCSLKWLKPFIDGLSIGADCKNFSKQPCTSNLTGMLILFSCFSSVILKNMCIYLRIFGVAFLPWDVFIKGNDMVINFQLLCYSVALAISEASYSLVALMILVLISDLPYYHFMYISLGHVWQPYS